MSCYNFLLILKFIIDHFIYKGVVLYFEWHNLLKFIVIFYAARTITVTGSKPAFWFCETINDGHSQWWWNSFDRGVILSLWMIWALEYTCYAYCCSWKGNCSHVNHVYSKWTLINRKWFVMSLIFKTTAHRRGLNLSVYVDQLWSHTHSKGY